MDNLTGEGEILNTLVLDTKNVAFIKNVLPCPDDSESIETRSIKFKLPNHGDSEAFNFRNISCTQCN